MTDFRIEWMKWKILTFFSETDEGLFDDMIAQNDGELKVKLQNFLNGVIADMTDSEKRLVFFYKSYYDKIVEEEIIVRELVPKPPPPPPPEPVVEEVVEEEVKGKKGKKGKKGGKGKGKGKASVTEDTLKEAVKVTDEGEAAENPEAVADTEKSDEIKPEGSEEVNTDADTGDGEKKPEETNTLQESMGEVGSNVSLKGSKSKVLNELEPDKEEAQDKTSKSNLSSDRKVDGSSSTKFRQSRTKSLSKEGRSSPSTLVESQTVGDNTDVDSEQEYVNVTKIVEKVVKAPMLHCHFGSLPVEHLYKSISYIYFLRQFEEGLTAVDSMYNAEAEMAAHIIVGSCTSRMIKSLSNLLKEVECPSSRAC